MEMAIPALTGLKKIPGGIAVSWGDGRAAELSWGLLRRRCPCATCRTKSKEPAPLFSVLTPAEAQPVDAVSMIPVGNYAYSIHFNDGHSSGIYSLKLLYQLSAPAE